MLLKTINFSLILLLTACASEPIVIYKQVELTRPSHPVLPKITRDELNCLSQSTYQKLYDRNRLLREYAQQLDVIIDSTHGK